MVQEGKTITELANGVTTWKLRRAAKENWSKIQQYDHTEFKLAPLLDRRTGRPNTGLSKDDAERIALALGREKHELYDHSPFWLDFFIGIGNGTTTIDITNPEEELLFLFLKAHRFVAFGHAELRIKSKALFVLYNDVDEAKAQNKGRNAKKIAYAKFAAMDNSEMIDTLLVMGERVISTDPSIIEAQMGRLVEKRPGDFVEIFGDNDFKMKLFVTKCLHYDILQRGKGKDIHSMSISFNSELIGEGLDAVVEKLNKNANQQLFLSLQKRLEMALGAGTLAGDPILTGYQIEEKLKMEPKGKNPDKIITSNAGEGHYKPAIAGKGVQVKDEGKVEEITGAGLNSPSFDESDL